jgi:hypothetical protein
MRNNSGQPILRGMTEAFLDSPSKCPECARARQIVRTYVSAFEVARHMTRPEDRAKVEKMAHAWEQLAEERTRPRKETS